MKLLIDDLKELYKLKTLVRYNNKVRIKDENVAEHSYYVSLFTLIICNDYNIKNYLKLVCLEEAILHDTPEIHIGEIPYDVKHLNKGFKKYLIGLETDYLGIFLKKFGVKRSYFSIMEINERTLCKLIVKLADTLSVLQYCSIEISLGNKSMKSIFNEAQSTISDLTVSIEKILEELNNAN